MAKDDQIPNLHFSEDEETERIKDWWKKNGISIIVGLAIGIGAVASYQGWNFYQSRQSEVASDLYQSMLRSFDGGSISSARTEADKIISKYSSTTYADGASLMLAKFDFEIGNLDKARIHLNRVMEKSNDSGLRHIARLRQATIAISDEDLDFAEVYDLSSAYELDWYEHIGLCEPGEARHLLQDGETSLGGRIPVNPSGGLGAFGEAIPAQAIAQVCELTWQLRGEAEGRQVENAKIGMSINYGMFGHGSSVVARL